MTLQKQLQDLKVEKQGIEEHQAKIDKEIEERDCLVKVLTRRQRERQTLSYDEERFVEEHAKKLKEVVDKAAPVLDYADAAIAYGRHATENAQLTDWSSVAQH